MTSEPARHEPNSKGAKNISGHSNAALRGASMAFGKPVVAPKPLANTYSGNNEALAAATKAGRTASLRPTGTRISDDDAAARQAGVRRGGEPPSEPDIIRRRHNEVARAESDYLQLPQRQNVRSRSPSQVAASLAASRSALNSPYLTEEPPTPSPFVQQRQANPEQFHSSRPYSTSIDARRAEMLDTTPIPPTSSLVGMFEKSTAPEARITKLPSPVTTSKGLAPQLQSPAPRKASKILLEEDPVDKAKVTRLLHPEVRKPIRSPSGSFKKNSYSDDSSGESFVSATDLQTPSPPQRHQQSPGKSKVHRNVADDNAAIEAMANAIIASTLATSRANSPTKSTLSRSSLESSRPNLPPRRRTPSIFHIHHHNNQQLQDARTPSPAKGMRTTMRKPPKEVEEGDQRSTRRKIIKKHPNKHHEGDRKRWRDAVTDRERKRYEAVWASNKGLFLNGKIPVVVGQASGSPSDSSGISRNMGNPADCVCNIVVRDIWSRSRLGDDVLYEVWELVDRSGRGYLSREEFVAGLWLIDQRLKGRKLPIRVGESVWASLGGLGGVKVKGGKRVK